MEKINENNINEMLINQRLSNLCDEFKNRTNVSKNYIEYISALLYMKYVKDYESNINVDFEKIYIKRNNFYIANIINEELEKMRNELNNNYLFSNIDFKNIVVYRKMGENNVLSDIIKKIYTLENNCEGNNKYIIAKIYENILQESIINGDIIKMQNEFYTPKYITNMIANMVIQEESENVYDPYSGSGNLLLSANKNKKLKTMGIEKNINMYNICMTNLLLHNIENKDIQCQEYNLKKDMKFDIILSNPPFSQKGWHKEMSEEDKKYIEDMGLPKTAVGDYAYVLTMLKTLNKDGKMAVILPHGVLFRENEIKVRENLVQSNYIDAIIGLPENMFYSTRISVIVLVLLKNKKDDEVLFIDASKYYKNGRKNNTITEEMQEEIIDIYINRKQIEGCSYLASKEEIKKNQYNLTIKRYIKEPIKEKIKVRKQKIISELENLENEKDILEENIKDVIEALGIQEIFIKETKEQEETKNNRINYIKIGEKIKRARKKIGYTQEQLAEKMEVSAAYIARIETGRTNINLARLIEICKMLNVSETKILNNYEDI